MHAVRLKSLWRELPYLFHGQWRCTQNKQPTDFRGNRSPERIESLRQIKPGRGCLGFPKRVT